MTLRKIHKDMIDESLLNDVNNRIKGINEEIKGVTETINGVNDRIEQLKSEMENLNIQEGSITQQGIVQLEDSVTSESITKASTPNSVKKVNDALLLHKEDESIHVSETDKANLNYIKNNKKLIEMNGVKVIDARSFEITPSRYRGLDITMRSHIEFVDSVQINLVGYDNSTYATLETIVGWVDASGGSITQKVYTNKNRSFIRMSVLNTGGVEVWSEWQPLGMYSYGRPSNVNLNDYTTAGVYPIGGELLNGNAPKTDHWGVLIVEVSGDVIIQTTKGLNNHVWTRYKTATVNWTPWEQLLTTYHYDQLFQSVSNGKTLVANAITQKGVNTATNAEFATLANNIIQLPRRTIGSGTIYINGSYQAVVTGSTPNMLPNIIIVKYSHPNNRGTSVYFAEYDPSNVDNYMWSTASNTIGNYGFSFSRWYGGFTINISNSSAMGSYQFIAYG